MWSVVNGHIRFDAPFWPQTDAVGLNAKFKRIRRTGNRNKTEIELYKKRSSRTGINLTAIITIFSLFIKFALTGKLKLSKWLLNFEEWFGPRRHWAQAKIQISLKFFQRFGIWLVTIINGMFKISRSDKYLFSELSLQNWKSRSVVNFCIRYIFGWKWGPGFMSQLVKDLEVWKIELGNKSGVFDLVAKVALVRKEATYYTSSPHPVTWLITATSDWMSRLASGPRQSQKNSKNRKKRKIMHLVENSFQNMAKNTELKIRLADKRL